MDEKTESAGAAAGDNPDSPVDRQKDAKPAARKKLRFRLPFGRRKKKPAAAEAGSPASADAPALPAAGQAGEENRPLEKETDSGEISRGGEPVATALKAGSSVPVAAEGGAATENSRPAGDQEDAAAASLPAPKDEAGRPARKKPARSRKRKTAKKPENGGKKPGEDDRKGEEKEDKAASRPEPKIKLLINAEEPEECRIALIEDGKIESFHVATVVKQRKSNIYKGRITAVEPNLQAVFVDIGLEKNGFLPFGEIHPEYYSGDTARNKHWKDLKIQDVIRRGQEVLVQVVKEAAGNKGASMTTYLSIPGRYLILMPGSDSAGVSRKIDDESQRAELREMIKGFNIPEGIGYIIRTASRDMTKTSLSKDFKYLLRLWKEIKKRGQSLPAPAMIYEDQDSVSKFLRDHFTADIMEITVDSKESYDQVNNFMQLLPPKQQQTRVRLHKDARPIFNLYDIESQIEQIFQPVVKLPSGGSIVINPTEALVAIDVNSGRTSKDKNFNETIFLANMEAAAEMARQLRLRDLGGLIVVDFIDMRNSRHIREVEKQVKLSMKRDKAKVDISRISKFGLMQISRQKMGAPIQAGSYNVCEYCQGRGMVRSVETQALFYLRRIQTGIVQKKVKKVICRLPMSVAQYLLNNKKEDLIELEKQYHAEIVVDPSPDMKPHDHQIEFIRE